MTEPKFYKVKIEFQEIGTKNKVKLTLKKMTEKSYKDLQIFLVGEFAFKEPQRVTVEESKEKINRVISKMLDGEKGISA